MRARIMILLVLLTAGSSWTVGQTNPAGHWEGAISTPGTELGMIVELKQEASALSGTISIPAQGLKGFTLANVKLQGQQLSFEMPNITGTPTFTGTLSADGNSVEGTMSQGGGPFPLSFAVFPRRRWPRLPKRLQPKRQRSQRALGKER